MTLPQILTPSIEKAVKVLLENGADPNVIVTPAAGKFTALRYASMYGFTAVVQLLEQYK